MVPVIISSAQLSDLPKILEIEQASFPFPWDRATLAATLSDKYCLNLVAIRDGVLIGYCFAHQMKAMIHVLNLAVRTQWRRSGIARELMNAVIRWAEEHGKEAVFLEVRRSNLAAQSLYQSLTFRTVCTWHGYYSDINEDAHIMLKTLQPGH